MGRCGTSCVVVRRRYNTRTITTTHQWGVEKAVKKATRTFGALKREEKRTGNKFPDRFEAAVQVLVGALMIECHPSNGNDGVVTAYGDNEAKEPTEDPAYREDVVNKWGMFADFDFEECKAVVRLTELNEDDDDEETTETRKWKVVSEYK